MELFLTFENRFVLTAQITDRTDIRYTPAGVKVISVKLFHQSKQVEADSERRVEISVSAIGIGKIAEQIKNISLNKTCLFEGFLSAKSLKDQKLLFHITGFSLIE